MKVVMVMVSLHSNKALTKTPILDVGGTIPWSRGQEGLKENNEKARGMPAFPFLCFWPAIAGGVLLVFPSMTSWALWNCEAMHLSYLVAFWGAFCYSNAKATHILCFFLWIHRHNGLPLFTKGGTLQCRSQVSSLVCFGIVIK